MTVLRSLRHMFEPHPSAGEESFSPPDVLPAPAGLPPIRLRRMDMTDAEEWTAVRYRNREWLAPWESGDPLRSRPISYQAWIIRQRHAEACGTGILLAIEYQGHIVGQVSLGAISYGAMRSGIAGYWVDQGHAGRGFAPTAVAVLADWAFADPTGPRLHRIEIDILPQNARSRRVVQKLGLHAEGLRRDYMFVGGRWCDHESYSLLATDIRGSVTARLR